MSTKYSIAGYCRISVDEEMDRDNTSIENQKAIITDFVKRKFPDSTLEFYEDRDRSGYTFEQREGYQELRKKMLRMEYDILIVKDFSRFSRRNSKGLVELEDLRDAGMRIISIGDNIDYPTYDDWTAIQFRFLINEMPVTDTSKKVKSVIKRRQEEGKWICAVPYGYVMTNSKTMKFDVDEPAAQVVRDIFEKYNEGWGYKKIANYLTEKHIPTPRMCEKMRKEANGEECKREAKQTWSLVTISEILSNDFYIGTLRQGKYRRKRINGDEVKQHETDHIVFENNHTPIVDYKVFALAQENLKKRTTSHYRGVRKYENAYSGFLYCGDCGSPMFSMSRNDIAAAYTCGTYHRRGTKGCTSHHTRVDMLDKLLKEYIQKVRDNSQDMIERLQNSIAKEQNASNNSKSVVELIKGQIEDAKAEMKMLTRQQTRDVMRHPERTEIIEETYTEMIDELTLRIEGLKNQLQLAVDKNNAIVRVNRTAKTVFEIFDNILNKPTLDKNDINLIIDKITVYEDHIDIQLKADIDCLLTYGTLDKPESVSAMADVSEKAAENFNKGTESKKSAGQLANAIKNSKGKVLSVNVISNGDPLEIYTGPESEVIFKKYSPVNELENAAEACEVIARLGGAPAIIFDRDHVVAVSGIQKKEYAERRISPALEDLLESRKTFFPLRTALHSAPSRGVDSLALAAAPIISAGDIVGAVTFLATDEITQPADQHLLLAKTAAMFLGKQIEGKNLGLHPLSGAVPFFMSSLL